jgi:MFS transporter, DHA1 family, tetracycline resistance protein
VTQQRLSFERVLPIFTLTFVDVMGLTIILPLLHLYAAAFGATPLQIGLVAAAFPLAQLLGVPVMGALSDRYGRKPLLLISQVSTCASFLMLASATSLEMIILSRVVDGLFGANLATAQAAITDLTDERTRTQGLGLTGAAFGLGFIFGPAIALISLEFSSSLAIPALIAAAYSFLSILLTLFGFEETLPPKRRRVDAVAALFNPLRMLRQARTNHLLVLMFAQQIIFFAFESLLGLFTLSRLGLLGQGNAFIFIYVGVILVYVQVRMIGRWSRKYGERKLVFAALGLLALGLLMMAITPDQPHPLYIERQVEASLRDLAPSSTEAIIGDIPITLPEDSQRGIGGIIWFLIAILPLAIGSGIIRPALNSLMLQRAQPGETGAILGISASFISLANAVAPLIGGWIFQSSGVSAPFIAGGVVMTALLLVSLRVIQPEPNQRTNTA